MVKITQDIQAAFEVEDSYGDAPDTELFNLGLLDTFDPRAVNMNITPVPSLGQSTDAFHAAGPIDVTLPLKVALQGNGWKELLGNAIGKTDISGSIDTAHSLTTDTYSHIILAKDLSTGHYTLCNGVVVNEATLEADYTTGGYMTLDAQCTAMYSEDSDNGNFTFNPGSGAMQYDGLAFPACPTSDPLLPTDLTVSFSAASDPLSTSRFVIQDDDALQLTDTAGKYVEIGERYMRFFIEANDAVDTEYGVGDNDAIISDGVIDLDHANVQTLSASAGLASVLNAAHSGTVAALGSGATSFDSSNLLKGIYKMTGSAVNIPCIADTTETLTEFTNLKTVSLKIANNNTPIPGRIDSKWLQNYKIARGKADITLDLTMTAHNEDLYDLYTRQITLPLVRLDFGTNGSIALTNGTITSFTRPLSPGGEIVDTLSIKFRGAGDYRNFSAFAISTDLTLQ
jgi:hypothetical protein